MRLLVVEDEPKLAEVILRATRREGWSVDVAVNGTDAVWHGTEFDYDVVVLDVGIPDPDGFAVCEALRAAGRRMPILFLTARDEVADRVRGLDVGGDDYLVKPFSIDELGARLRALARRTMGARPTELVVGDVVIDPAAHTVTRAGEPIALSAKEFAILEFMARRKGEVVSRTQLLDHAWDMAFEGGSNVIDVYIRYLREKIDRPFGVESIETVRGVGYRLDPDGGRA